MIWNWLYEPRTACSHKPLPANHSGIKVLAAGPAKTGTSSITEAFHEIGLEQAYHGPDVKMHVWRPLIDEFWRRPENGGNGDLSSIATTRPPANLGTVWRTTDSDQRVLAKMRLEDLAARLSSCRVDSMTFDGHERLFWPTLEVSPGVKVVMLSWRTFQQWEKSLFSFSIKHVGSIHLIAHLLNCVHILPWGLILWPALDGISGGAIDSFLQNGRPVTFAKGPFIKYAASQVNNRWIFAHGASGISDLPIGDEKAYYAWFDEVRKRVPAKDRIEWNMKNKTLKDMCDFLDIKGHPGCKLPMPRVTTEILRSQLDEPFLFAAMSACYIMIHIVNYKIIYGVLGWFIGLVKSPRKPKGE